MLFAGATNYELKRFVCPMELMNKRHLMKSIKIFVNVIIFLATTSGQIMELLSMQFLQPSVTYSLKIPKYSLEQPILDTWKMCCPLI